MRLTALLAALVLVAGCAGKTETSRADVRAALEARLASKRLSYEWVYCLRTPRAFEGKRIFRCNVNFGEPHIVIYCVTLDGDMLVTNRERPGIRCGRDA